MKYKKNTRMCAICRERKAKDSFFRLVKMEKVNEARLDDMLAMQGRGAYVCKSENCIAAAKKTRALSRSLKCFVSDELFDEMMRMIQEK